MLRSDSRKQVSSTDIDNNMNSITIAAVCEIEKELSESPYDVTSLVFLLYDIPDTALQRLLVHQRVSKDISSTNLNLLHDWIQGSKSKPTWKNEFLEALLICQLYSIVRKLGFNVQNMKRQYQPDNIYYNKYINPTKKILYKLCENIDSDNLSVLKQTLNSYEINTEEYESCELIFLKLMSKKIITLNEFHGDLGDKFNFEKLIKLIQKLPGLDSFADELKRIQNNGKSELYNELPVPASSPSPRPSSDLQDLEQTSTETKKFDNTQFEDTFALLNNLTLEEHMKSDSKKPCPDSMYPIKDSKKIGVCLIINQENFHLCDQSIEDQNLKTSLSKRKGSSYDKIELEKTMSSFNFEVITKDNLDHVKMIEIIKQTIKENVVASTSIFMLCIMSHGVRDHVYAANCVKVKVEDIQRHLDKAKNLQNIPKVMIIQACQVDENQRPETTLVADSPGRPSFTLPKLDYLVYWATSPELEAFRAEESGTIFIKSLCQVIQDKGKQEHLNDIFTEVNNTVNKLCNRLRCEQVPLFKSSLRKKLYLHAPNM